MFWIWFSEGFGLVWGLNMISTIVAAGLYSGFLPNKVLYGSMVGGVQTYWKLLMGIQVRIYVVEDRAGF